MLLERGLFPHSPMPFNGTLTDIATPNK